MIEPLPLAELERVERYVASGRRFAKDALVVAVALNVMAPIAGRTWTAVCCWCLDRLAHDLPDTHVHRIARALGGDAGGCMRCMYSGCDTLVASLENS